MLSKKMTFSLMSLITLLAFAFVTVPAMAKDDFDATFSVDSISTSSDHNAQYAARILSLRSHSEQRSMVLGLWILMQMMRRCRNCRSWLKISLVRKEVLWCGLRGGLELPCWERSKRRTSTVLPTGDQNNSQVVYFYHPRNLN